MRSGAWCHDVSVKRPHGHARAAATLCGCEPRLPLHVACLPPARAAVLDSSLFLNVSFFFPTRIAARTTHCRGRVCAGQFAFRDSHDHLCGNNPETPHWDVAAAGEGRLCAGAPGWLRPPAAQARQDGMPT